MAGRNVIAIRVYDRGGIGGIYSGDVALYAEKNPLELEVILPGLHLCLLKEFVE